MAGWPHGARGALSLSFDNFSPAGTPDLLAALRARELAATFFVEGVNAEPHPDSLRELDASGHEVAYHAWDHEDWGGLSAAEQAANLERGSAAFDRLGLEVAGLRPPGGGLGEGGLGVIREAGLRYCSPAGAGAGSEAGLALLPFQWRHVDASCMLPPLTAVREEIGGSPDPIEPPTFLAHLEAEIARLESEGGFMAIVLHLALLEWLGADRLAALLDRIASANGLWVATCADLADHVLANPAAFENGTVLDRTTWAQRPS